MDENILTDIENLRIGAESLKTMFDEYVLAGFTRFEALELIKAIISVSIMCSFQKKEKEKEKKEE